MKPRTISLVFALSWTLWAAGCLQKVSTGATSGAGTRDPNAAPTTAIEPSALPIQTDPNDEGKTITDPCEKTRADKTQILTAYCAGCHAGAAAFGLPKFDFVLDDAALISRVWAREGQPPQRFVIPGDPDHSVVYTRVAIIGDMPAQPSDLATPRSPSPSLSDIAILREWIANCTGAPAQPGAGTGGTGGASTGAVSDGGSWGVGGAGGSGGSGGGVPDAGGVPTGGRGGSSDAGGPDLGGTVASDAGPPDAGGLGDASVGVTDAGGPATCAPGVTGGGGCQPGSATCRLGAQTCSCNGMNGARRWVCR